MSDTDRFATFVATLGRGPGRSRALTREEAHEALAMVLAGRADPMQVGAFLMLLRYRGEDADEVVGLVEAAREAARLAVPGVALDWPSYGAGRTRGAPWFLMAALALGRAGVPVLMHGSNQFSSGMSVLDGLAGLGLAPVTDAAAARAELARHGFAYVPLQSLSPGLERLLASRTLFGLRSPINTVCRLLNPAGAPAAVDGVFHPPYIEVHLGAAERLGSLRLLVLKGGGGEAERNPAKLATLHLTAPDLGRQEFAAPAISDEWQEPPAEAWRAVWSGEAANPAAEARIVATIALGLLAVGNADTVAEADLQAAGVWRARHERPHGNQDAMGPLMFEIAREAYMVDEDRAAGIGHQVKGSVKEAAGKVTGDTKMQAEGTAEKTAGKVQNTVGGAKDAVRDTVKK